ncbi:ROK family protein [Prolixibacter denitrificans]|jgi:glucokinase|uniref:Glucokinase n=1 Tax=Prolixibacter denitrificans TaxID=1541063 RepID=A0A2P8CHL6_9BACT|nr:ROK family protein [Prolixibacter denitrificans]PSK84464.1 glucokinase [Prolixibacter denitrificans]GET20637.1 glucokinase [Prolixibacter denitrificans]
MKRVAIGIDIGGTNTVLGVVDENGDVLVKDSISTPNHGDVGKYVASLSESINELIDSVHKLNADAEVMGIGIGAPNGNYYKGTIEQAANLAFKGVVPLVDLLKENFPHLKALALTNDANAAAMGEMIYGGAKGMKNFVMITLGTGLGSGIVVNGDLVYGHDGFAGEVGHTTVIPHGRVCGCGGAGHLEAYCSAPGIKRTVFELLTKYNGGSELTKYSFDELDSKKVFEAAEKGDKVALEAFEITGELLGQGLGDTVCHLSPEAIFLFGGPTAAGDLIFKPTKESMERHVLPIFRNKVEILPSKLKAGSAAIVGASALVWKELEKE